MTEASGMVCNDDTGYNNNSGQSSVQQTDNIEVLAAPEPENFCIAEHNFSPELNGISFYFHY